MCGLRKAFAFFLVKVNVVYPERRIRDAGLRCPLVVARRVVGYYEVVECVNVECDTDFVVLEGNER